MNSGHDHFSNFVPRLLVERCKANQLKKNTGVLWAALRNIRSARSVATPRHTTLFRRQLFAYNSELFVFASRRTQSFYPCIRIVCCDKCYVPSAPQFDMRLSFPRNIAFYAPRWLNFSRVRNANLNANVKWMFSFLQLIRYHSAIRILTKYLAQFYCL